MPFFIFTLLGTRCNADIIFSNKKGEWFGIRLFLRIPGLWVLEKSISFLFHYLNNLIRSGVIFSCIYHEQFFLFTGLVLHHPSWNSIVVKSPRGKHIYHDWNGDVEASILMSKGGFWDPSSLKLSLPKPSALKFNVSEIFVTIVRIDSQSPTSSIFKVKMVGYLFTMRAIC